MATIGEKELKRKWPHVSGLTARTTKQEGRQPRLIAKEGSTVPQRRRKLL